jgi:hypothetical protein
MKNAYRILVREHEEERPLERSGKTREDNIRIDPKSIKY